MTGAAVAKWPTNADRERQAYINAVLEWQRVYGCSRTNAEAAVSQILDTPNTPIRLDDWSRQRRAKRGRPGSPAITSSQNVGVLAHYYERAGVRPMQAI